MTAFAKAFKDAGYVDPAEQIRNLARLAYERHPNDWVPAKEMFLGAVRKDATLLWALLGPYANQAVHRVLSEAAAKVRAEKRTESRGREINEAPVERDGRGQPADENQSCFAPPARNRNPEAMRAAANVVALSLLDTVLINNKPVGDVTAGEAKSWARSQGRKARFVELLAANLPERLPIRQFRTAEDAAEIHRRVQEEIQ